MKRIIAFIIAVIICTAGMCMSIIYMEVKSAGALEPKSDLHIPTHCLAADVTDQSECAGREELQLYEYDANGNVIRKTAGAKDGGIPSYTSYYRYEDAGSICVTVFYDGEGKPSSFDSEIRDENGNKLSDYNYDGDGNRRSYTYAKYDEDGCYIYQTNGKGETDDSPMKELITEWDDETHTSKETLYEPIGHINAVQYNTYTEEGKQLSGIRYFSGYHGHTESEWNMQLEFTEGYWAGVRT